MLVSYFLPPILGGVIGYITNDIAIRMLFRPHKPKYLFGWKVPFTPGIIPKEKGRIAAAVGEAISENLMNREVLAKTLLSDDILAKISSAIDSFCNSQKSNDETVRAFVGHYLTGEDIDKLSGNISRELELQVSKALAGSELGQQIAHIAVEHAIEKTSNGLLGMFGAGNFVALLAEPAEAMLAKQIDEMLDNNAVDIVHNLISTQADDFMSQPVSSLFVGHDEQIAQAKNALIGVYRTIILNHLSRILQALNISRIIEERINEMDMDEVEPLILQVMDKELKAIVWFGAGLGALIGCINILI